MKKIPSDWQVAIIAAIHNLKIMGGKNVQETTGIFPFYSFGVKYFLGS
jgi:hypothetical protein